MRESSAFSSAGTFTSVIGAVHHELRDALYHSRKPRIQVSPSPPFLSIRPPSLMTKRTFRIYYLIVCIAQPNTSALLLL